MTTVWVYTRNGLIRHCFLIITTIYNWLFVGMLNSSYIFLPCHQSQQTGWPTYLLTDRPTDWQTNCCSPSPAQWSLVPSPTGPMTTFYCLTALPHGLASWVWHAPCIPSLGLQCLNFRLLHTHSLLGYGGDMASRNISAGPGVTLRRCS
jgi:hypothetical protein